MICNECGCNTEVVYSHLPHCSQYSKELGEARMRNLDEGVHRFMSVFSEALVDRIREQVVTALSMGSSLISEGEDVSEENLEDARRVCSYGAMIGATTVMSMLVEQGLIDEDLLTQLGSDLRDA